LIRRSLNASILILALAATLLLCSAQQADAFVYRCHGVRATIIGTPDDDHIKGTPHSDVIVGRAGDDVIRGGSGDDLICGGGGGDILRGLRGDDEIYGDGGGDDQLFGGQGDDEITDSLVLKMSGGTGNDTFGGDEFTRDTTPDGVPILSGGDGADRVISHTPLARARESYGYGEVDLGAGDDVFQSESFGAAPVRHLVAGGGDDRVIAAPILTGIGPDAPMETRVEGGSGNDHISLVTSPDDDPFATGGDGQDTLTGGSGPDFLTGGPGDDDVSGAEGDDTLWGGGNADILRGGPGLDTCAGFEQGYADDSGDRYDPGCEQRTPPTTGLLG
jgi:Ca2+-binding RTX toxin-like protein